MYYSLTFIFQLKAFYVDLLVPLETNLEKDTKVVQVCTSNIQLKLLTNSWYFSVGAEKISAAAQTAYGNL